MYNCIILIGPPCSGKSTIGKKLAELIRYHYVSSGDIARRLANIEDAKKLNNGEMFDEDKMRYEMYNILSNTNNVVLDGFPRFEDQLIWLMDKFPEVKYTFMHIDTPLIEIARRAVERDRDDDCAIGKRLKYYSDNTYPILTKATELGYTLLEVYN